MNYPDTQLHIRGKWRDASDGRTLPVINPATGQRIGTAPIATTTDLDEAALAAYEGFQAWRLVSPFERYKIMRQAAQALRNEAAAIARVLTLEQGKPVAEAEAELNNAADILDWFAEEGRRAYGRLIPARALDATQTVVKEPVGPVAAFSPWNFPVVQAIRKIGGALAAGCSIIVKGPEETPASCAAMVKALVEAGLPDGALNLVYGVPADISSHLIAHPAIRKISFTGSTPVGRQLAALAGQHMKRATMELGGHGPVLVFDDVDVRAIAELLARSKFRNAGQVCISPTRFLVQRTIYKRFVDTFTDIASSLRVGDGMDAATQMGPLAHDRRLAAMEHLVDDAKEKGARIACGGASVDSAGYFFSPTVLTDVPLSARIMNEEPFGPVAPISPFDTLEDAIREGNRLPYGLSAYVYTSSGKIATRAARELESGMVSINQQAVPLPETPFGGVKDSGHGLEGGIEGLECYLSNKIVCRID